ncbi:MAG TPA: hypothetical protein VNT52_09480 [Acidimicrobiales bacterium]|nr:hypothetical protein [Acidimicrobiales bacterium]
MLSLVPTVLLGVCTPDELGRWPELGGSFSTATTTSCRRLAGRPQEEVESALADAREHRRLHLPVVDTSGRPVDEVASELAALAVRGR